MPSDKNAKFVTIRVPVARVKFPSRVLQRPDPRDWREDELMNLEEAVALFWPDGPLSVTSLRTAVRDQKLAITVIAGKFLTTKRALLDMSRVAPLSRTAPVEATRPAEPSARPSPKRIARRNVGTRRTPEKAKPRTEQASAKSTARRTIEESGLRIEEVRPRLRTLATRICLDAFLEVGFPLTDRDAEAGYVLFAKHPDMIKFSNGPIALRAQYDSANLSSRTTYALLNMGLLTRVPGFRNVLCPSQMFGLLARYGNIPAHSDPSLGDHPMLPPGFSLTASKLKKIFGFEPDRTGDDV